jgi:hypothetical protein
MRSVGIMTLVQVSDFGGDRPRRSDSRRRAVEMEGGGGCGEVASDPLRFSDPRVRLMR